MSIWLQVMLWARPSSEIDFVSPVMACFVDVYGALCGRGVCAEIDPLSNHFDRIFRQLFGLQRHVRFSAVVNHLK